MVNTLPSSVSARLLKFCASISNEKPKFIISQAEPDANFGYCFDNVERKIARANGKIAYGWVIWHLRGLYYEAEHHGVWQDNSGELIDVSPQVSNYGKILFLPDSLAIYDSNAVRDNLFEPDSDNPLAVEFVTLARRRTAILSTHRSRGQKIGHLNSTEQSEIDQLLLRMRQIITDLSLQI